MNSHEESIVRSFFVASKRERYLNLLDGPRRAKALDRLNHLGDLDPRFATDVKSSADVLKLLRSMGAPENVYVMSSMPEFDGREMPLKEILQEIHEGNDLGVLIGCIPGKLAYYHGEYGEQRVLLKR